MKMVELHNMSKDLSVITDKRAKFNFSKYFKLLKLWPKRCKKMSQ